jgi:hypothetical protein
MEDRMYYILIIWPFILFSAFIILYGADKELKYLKDLKIKKVKTLDLKKFRFLFLYTKRNEFTITRFVFINSIIFYIINLSAIILLVIHLLTKIDYSYTICCILFLLNLLLILCSLMRISLKREQLKIKQQDQKNKRENL